MQQEVDFLLVTRSSTLSVAGLQVAGKDGASVPVRHGVVVLNVIRETGF